MADAVYRQWLLLRRIPRTPRRASTRALWEKLRDEDHRVSKRTVERDLLALAAHFPLTSETIGATTHWFWPEHAAAFDVPGLDPSGALALVLAHEHLETLLPASTLDVLAPHLRRAREVLNAEAGKRLGGWRSKVRAIARGPALLVPKVQPSIHAAVTDALLREKRLRARYCSRQTEGAKEYELNPLALVTKDGVLYLIATARDYDTPFQYALHRFTSAEATDDPAQRPAGFSLARYIDEQAAFSYPEGGGMIRLVADFDADVAAHLAERPLARDQTLTECSDGRVRVSANVADTQELRWWLLGFGEGVEVVAPAALRREFLHTSKRMAGRYARSPKS